MSTVGSIREAWGLLEQAEARDLRVQDLDVEINGAGSLAVGLDALGRRHLLIPVPFDRPVVEDRRSSGVQITRHVLVDGEATQAFVDVACTKAHLNELFDVVLDEMIRSIPAEPGAPDLACRRVLERWRELIEQEIGAGAGPERLAGLFAELWHLRELARIAPAAALDVWVGPHGARHDFMGRGASLEVKASLSRQGRFPEIHSAEQLERPVGADLYLAIMKLERVAASGETVGQVADQIGDMGVDRVDLLSLMKEAGFQPADLDPEHPTRFSVVEHRAYLVDDTFPSITPERFLGGRIPDGVLSVRYVIDLSTDVPPPLENDSVSAVYRLLLAE